MWSASRTCANNDDEVDKHVPVDAATPLSIWAPIVGEAFAVTPSCSNTPGSSVVLYALKGKTMEMAVVPNVILSGAKNLVVPADEILRCAQADIHGAVAPFLYRCNLDIYNRFTMPVGKRGSGNWARYFGPTEIVD